MIEGGDESSVAFFITLVRARTAESISEGDFRGIFRDMFFSTMWENLFQLVLPGVRVGNVFRETC